MSDEIKFEDPPEDDKGSPFAIESPDEEFVLEDELAAKKAAETPPEPEGPTREELKAELDGLKAQYEDANRRGDEVVALKESMDGIKEALSYQPQQQQPQRQPGESEEAYRKRFNEGYIEDPYQNQMEFYNKKVEPFLNTFISRSLHFSKKLAEKDHPDTFKRYEPEIDKLVQQMDRSDPEVYEKAHDMVLVRHMDEVKVDWKAQIKQELLEEMKGQPQPTPQPPPSTYSTASGPTEDDEQVGGVVDCESARAGWTCGEYGRRT